MPFDIGFFSRYSIAEGTFPFYLQYQNVFFTLFLGLLTLVIIEKVALKISGDGRKSKVTKILCQLGVVIIMAIIAELVKCDYGSQGIVYVSMLYFLRKSRLLQKCRISHNVYGDNRKSANDFYCCCSSYNFVI